MLWLCRSLNINFLDGCNVALRCEHDMEIPKKDLFALGRFAVARCLDKPPRWGFRAWGTLGTLMTLSRMPLTTICG